MNKTLAESVLINLKPNTFYRARDIADEMAVDQNACGKALRELSQGGGD